jgi:hypothetical protein
VRRDVYVALGGLDEGRWARDMEDVEFGHRLVDAGHRIDVIPAIQGTHLKRYTVRTMVATDLVHRAIPWSRLVLQGHLRSDRFVASWPQRISAACAMATVAGGVAVARDRRALVPLLVASLGFVAVNLPLWRFLARVRSVGFSLACIPLHLLYALVTAVGFGYALARPGTTDRATGEAAAVSRRQPGDVTRPRP